MTVSTEWFDELDGENQESGSIDTYIDVDGGGIQFNTDQISSSTFDGGIPSSTPSNTTVYQLKRGDYAFWNLTTGSPITVSAGSDIDGDIDFTDDYVDNMYLVVDIETDDTLADPDSSTATRYIYLQDEEDVKRVSATGSSSVTIIRESDDISEWDAGSTGWLLTSSGNAIFGNVLVRGTIDASTIIGSTITGTEFTTVDDDGNTAISIPTSGVIKFKSVAASGTQYSSFITIDNSDPDISAVGDAAGLNIYNFNSSNKWVKLSFDVNEMQAATSTNTSTATTDPLGITEWTASSFSINKFGGNIGLGSIGSTTTVKGNLGVDGTLTATTFNPTSISTGAITASGAITFNSTGTMKLGGDGINVLISAPSLTGRALNVGGSINIEGDVGLNTITYRASADSDLGYIIVNDTTQFNGFFYCPDIYNTTSGSTTANVRVSSDGRLLRISSTQNVKDNIYNLSIKELSSSIENSKISNEKIFDANSVLNISPVSYTSLIDSSVNIGFIAEDVAEKAPLLAEYDDDSNVLFYNLSGIVASMLVVMQEQQNRIKTLEERLAILEG